MEPTALLPFRKRSTVDFISLKNPSLLTGFEPANLASNGKQVNHYTTEATKK
jgi:hypothetical protein